MFILTMNNAPFRIGTLEQMEAFKEFYSPWCSAASIQPVSEVKRRVPYWYYAENELYGNSLFVFEANARLFAGTKTVFELPKYSPQGVLM